MQNKTEIKCSACDRWFPSPIGFGDRKAFSSFKTSGTEVNCTHCGAEISVLKSRMRFTDDAGVLLGE